MAVGSAFHERLAYARWLLHLRTGDCPADADIARGISQSAPWVAKWKVRTDAPDSRERAKALSSFLGVREEWLIDNEGEPPEPNLWDRWIAERRRVRPSHVRRATAPNEEKGRGRAG